VKSLRGPESPVRLNSGYAIPFALVHAGCALAAVTGASWGALAVCGATYALRAFGVTAGFHRYFAHRSFKTSRGFQLVLAILGTMAVQKGALWWAAHHRRHHRYADQSADIHSPRHGGFWWSHMGWFLAADYAETDWPRVRDWTVYPELLWLNEHFVVPPIALALVLLLTGGLPWLVWGFFVSTVLTWHLTYAVNSLAHRFGSRRYDTGDDSRNSFWLALLTWGEGWHNNHHRYMTAARQGFFWWEIDLTYGLLAALQRVGVIWDVIQPPTHLVRERDAVTASHTDGQPVPMRGRAPATAAAVAPAFDRPPGGTPGCGWS